MTIHWRLHRILTKTWTPTCQDPVRALALRKGMPSNFMNNTPFRLYDGLVRISVSKRSHFESFVLLTWKYFSDTKWLMRISSAAAVAKMMAKMGYREGQGLGRSQQGMSSALVVEKTSKRGGKIVHEKDVPVRGNPRIELLLLRCELSGYFAEIPFFAPPPPPPPLPPSLPVPTMIPALSVPKVDSGVDISVALKSATKVVLLKVSVHHGRDFFDIVLFLVLCKEHGWTWRSRWNARQ